MTEFDSLVHQPTRLRLFAYLYRSGTATFPELRDALELTEGNLSTHLSTMEDAGAVAVEKTFVDRRPQTTYELTAEGERRFEDHVERLDDLVADLEL